MRSRIIHAAALITLAGISMLAVVLAHRAFLSQPVLGPDPCPDDAGNERCWETHYDALARSEGSRVALEDLRTRYLQGGYARAFCHSALHAIGAAAADEFDSISEAYSRGDTFCRSGYHHGVLEGIFVREGNTDLLNNLDAICADVPGKERYSYDYYSCVHGIGHGLMAHYSHNVLSSLAACDNLAAEWERSSCYGGVFMENIIAHSPETPSKYLSNDPLYPCNAVDDRYRYQCYQMQTSHMLTLFKGDFGQVFVTCGSAEEKYRTACYQSLGRDASGWSYGSPGAVYEMCGQGETTEQYTQCVFGAAVDFIQSVNVSAARDLCAFADDASRKPCADALEYHIQSL